MESSWHVLLDVLILLSAALVLGTLAEQVRQSAIIGYLLAGTLVGRNVIGLVKSGDHVEVIAELGVALLLFTVGLEFSFKRLRRLGRVAVIGGSLQVLVTMLAAGAVAGVLGLNLRASLAIGALVALSSTACVLRLLVDRAAVESIYGRNAVGILLLQDAAVIPLMLLMVMLSVGGSLTDAGLALLRGVVLAAGLIAAFYVLLNFVVPRLLNIRRWVQHRELPILLAIVVALGSAAAAHQVAISPALGAFIGGVLLGESPFAVQIRADVGSLRTLLVTLFFASIGILAEPVWMLHHWQVVTSAVAAIVVGKMLIVWAVVRLLGFAHGLAAATGLCVAQVGEFSFVLAEMGRGQSVSEDTFRLIIAATIITLFLTPFMVAAAPHVATWIDARRNRRAGTRLAAASAPGGTAGDGSAGLEPEELPRSQPGDAERSVADIFIIGFGPSGQCVADALLRQHRRQMVVIDLNPRNVMIARRDGLTAQVGDASHRDVLEHTRIHRARVIVITVPDPNTSRTIIHHCKYLAPNAAIIARARYHVRRWELHLAGALEVVDEEEQVGLRLAAEVRKHLHVERKASVCAPGFLRERRERTPRRLAVEHTVGWPRSSGPGGRD